jgi:hypothetical protein
VAALDQRLDQRDDLGDRLAGERLVVGPLQAERARVRDVGLGHLARELLARHAALAGGVVDLVVDVGDVGHEDRLVALVLEEALEQREHDERARVADVHPPVHGRAAGVDAHPRRIARLEWPLLTGQRVVNADLAHVRRERLRAAAAPWDGG